MMKLMIPAVRRPDMSHEAFVRHVSQVHGPLLLSVPDVLAHIRHYHYDFPVLGTIDPVLGHPIADHIDVLTQIWFDDRDAMIRNIGTAGYREKVRPDEDNFADHARVVPHLTHEHGLSGTLESRYKVFHFRRRRAGSTRESFQKAWLAGAGSAVSSLLELGSGIAGYVQNHAMGEADHRDGTQDKYFDVIDEFAVDDLAALTAQAPGAGFRSDIAQWEAALTDCLRTRAYVTYTQTTIP